jgi:aspartate-semialdehyde dehydrogenase
MTDPNFGVIGATGVLGKQVLSALLARNIDPEHLRLFGSERSVGEDVDYGEEVLAIEPIGPDAFRGLTAAIVAVPADSARLLALRLQQEGVWAIDVSGAFRTDAKIPLVAPGLNDGVLDRSFAGRIVSVAHPVTQLILSALEPLRAEFGLLVADVTVLASASLYGTAGIDRLSKQTAELMNAKEPEVETFAHRLAFNLIPAVGSMESAPGAVELGLSSLERHVLVEAARIWSGDALPALTVTSVLVPTYSGALATITAHLKRPVDAEGVRALLKASSALKLLDAPADNVYPMPMLTTDDPSIHVGRVRARGERVQLVAAIDNSVRLADDAVELAIELAER